jgi:hypothetical protein
MVILQVSHDSHKLGRNLNMYRRDLNMYNEEDRDRLVNPFTARWCLFGNQPAFSQNIDPHHEMKTWSEMYWVS